MNNISRPRSWLERIRGLVEDRRRSPHWRELIARPAPKGARDETLDLSSNDYLRLSNHPHIVERVRQAAEQWGVGAGSSRLVRGTLESHTALEDRFARFKGAESALLFPTGYMANLAVLSTIPQRSDLLVLDKRSHASLIDGSRLAEANGVKVRTFRHGHFDRLERLLGEHRAISPTGGRFIVTDSVFSMDGDLADLGELARLRTSHDAALIIDEAHATGVLGERGEGLDSSHLADVTISTASKALGSLGGIVTGPGEVIDWLINAARSFIYTTASSPLQVAAIDAALDVIDAEPQRRLALARISAQARESLRGVGVGVSTDLTPIIPIVVGSAERAIGLSAHLRRRGILAPAIRPPTVAPNSSRVRVSLHCELSAAALDRFAQALAEFDAGDAD